MTTPDRIEPPAKAYRVVATLLAELGLSERYFAKAPPREGVRLTVVGLDDVPTQWDMELAWASDIVPRLQMTNWVRRVASIKYEAIEEGM